MDLWDSSIRVMWDPDGACLVLVPYGAPMWAPVRLDGGQEVETASPIRAAGVKNYPRRLDSHRIDFSLARIQGSVAEAIADGLENILTLPRTMKDVLLSFEDGRHFRVKNCAIQRWPQDYDPTHDHVSRETLVILGGELIADPGTYTEGSTWGDPPPVTTLTTEGDHELLTEAGEYLTTET